MQAEGHIHEAVKDLVKYVKGGFSALQYDSMEYLPCYAAAGLLIKLGLFNHLGKVQWMKTDFDMSSASIEHSSCLLWGV